MRKENEILSLEEGEFIMDSTAIGRQTEVRYDEYYVLCMSIRNQSGCIFSMPFIDSEGLFIGYLVYHNPLKIYSKDDFYKLLINTVAYPTLSGIVDGCSPLPYKIIPDEEIENVQELLSKIIEVNTVVDLSKEIKLPHSK